MARILYCGDTSAGQTSLYRTYSLKRLGYDVETINTAEYVPQHSKLAALLHYRFQFGFGVSALNRQVVERAKKLRPTIIWFDKPVHIWPKTILNLKQFGASIVHFQQDNPFGPRKDGIWRHVHRSLALYDVTAVPRESSRAEFTQKGAMNVVKINFSYEPTMHFPPPEGWDDRRRTREVSFTGTPYDHRIGYLRALGEDPAVPLVLDGPRWSRVLPPQLAQKIVIGKGSFGEDYRKAIWSSKINLTFVTHSNRDDDSHKLYEIAACGAFQIAESTEKHLQMFPPGSGIPFFSTFSECRALIERYLGDEKSRSGFAAMALRRVHELQVDNDSQLRKILAKLPSNAD